MAAGFQLVVGALTYAVLGRLILLSRTRPRVALFAGLNLAAVGLLAYRKPGLNWMLLAYVAIVGAHYLLVRRFAPTRTWIAFWAPLVLLVFVKWQPGLLMLAGISYMAFRLSYLALEVANGSVPMPRVEEYFAFAFFAPTITLGPISNYRTFHDSLRANQPLAIGPSLQRIIVGFTKYLFLGALFDSIAYNGLLHDGHQHGRVDFLVAAVCYYLFLYCNFSGFCDVAIGVAGLMNLRVQENFDRPFIARNPKEYWNRWHITLSHYMRDVVFSPMSKALTRWLGPKRLNHALAISVFTVFLLVGIWHGVGWNYFVFGLIHAVGVTANHYWGIALKSTLGAKRFKAYMANPIIHAVSVAATFAWVVLALASFAVPWWPEVYRGIFWR
jgi:D-alanyl-lipoteichoic acid acyltransferase DltB (MBOAT superfamily)